MLHPLLLEDASDATPIYLLNENDVAIARLPKVARDFASATGFSAKAGTHLVAPDGRGGLVVAFGVEAAGKAATDRFAIGKLPALLPAGDYRLVAPGRKRDLTEATLAWLMAQDRFESFKQGDGKRRRLVLSQGVDGAHVSHIATAVSFGRTLVNRPANDLGPAELSEAARSLAASHDAAFSETIGDDLLTHNFPMIHAVGRASSRAPRLIDFTWGDPDHPKVTLVGKGVCFDTGGLDIKPSSSMLLMKKDMGGAATALAAASILMASKARIRLRVLIPAVENSISGNAFRPGDILASRKGISVEIGNTDAEGRLILGDALALADEEDPELILDYATLTGAARVALGPDLPPFYTDDEKLAGEIASHAAAVNDPVWRMPLWAPYKSMLDSKVADINHVSSGGHAGSITAALFLRRFVSDNRAWAHFDVFNWNPGTKPGRPEGGEVQAARLTADLLLKRYGRA